jgi:hypothetical protein
LLERGSMMGVPEHEHGIEAEADAADAAELARAKELILEVASGENPSSLRELRNLLAHGRTSEVDPALLRVAVWALLNEHRLALDPDRTLHVAG